MGDLYPPGPPGSNVGLWLRTPSGISSGEEPEMKAQTSWGHFWGYCTVLPCSPSGRASLVPLAHDMSQSFSRPRSVTSVKVPPWYPVPWGQVGAAHGGCSWPSGKAALWVQHGKWG